MELRQLRYFIAALDSGQISRAARQLHMAQPAVSQAISSLERELGVSLLHRHAAGVDSTVAGQAFAVKARAVIAAADDAENTARAWSRGDVGELTVGFFHAAAEVARGVLADFSRGHPDVVVRPHAMDFTGWLTELRAGRVDAEIVIPAPGCAADLDVEPLYVTPWLVWMSSSHRLAGEVSLTFAQIAEESHPGRHPETSEEWADHFWLTKARGQRPPVIGETPVAADEVWALIAANRMISAAVEFLAPAYARNGVVAIPLLDVEPTIIALATRRQDDRPAVQALRDTARRHAEALRQPDGRLAVYQSS